MRRLVGALIVMVITLMVLKLLHLGVGHRIEDSAAARAAQQTYADIEIHLDKSSPTAPGRLTAGTAPTIIFNEHYLNRAFLTKHTAPIFDSTGGNLIVVCASSHNGTILTPSDSYKNTWISLAGPTNASAGADLRSQIWYSTNPTVGPNHTFTMNLSSGQALVISLFVVKGASLDPIDAVSMISDDEGTRTAAPTSSKIKTSAANDLLIGFGKSSISETWTAGDGFAFQPLASSDFLAAESGLAGVPGTYTSSFSITTPATWQSSVVAIRPALKRLTTAPIRLSWRSATDNVGLKEYQIERCEGYACRNFSQIGTSRNTSFVDANLAHPTIYRYRVRAIDDASNASGYSEIVSVTEDGAGD
ncbi:MAG: hypothetical protein ACRD40_06150 [Candidatus Acidiferrales bacterium]